MLYVGIKISLKFMNSSNYQGLYPNIRIYKLGCVRVKLPVEFTVLEMVVYYP